MDSFKLFVEKSIYGNRSSGTGSVRYEFDTPAQAAKAMSWITNYASPEDLYQDDRYLQITDPSILDLPVTDGRLFKTGGRIKTVGEGLERHYGGIRIR